MLRAGEGCGKDLGQAAIWSAKSDRVRVFWDVLEAGRRAFQKETTEDLGSDSNQLCYSIGWGLYWYVYGSETWNKQSDEKKLFGERCLDYYCCCIELQRESIFTFLLCWKQSVGVKDVGHMIGKMVWDGREDNFVKEFE
jgi:hypothetical protein